jgi:hypothetical protein
MAVTFPILSPLFYYLPIMKNARLSGALCALLLVFGVHSSEGQALYSSQESLNRVWSNPAETGFQTIGGLRLNTRLQRFSGVPGVPYQSYWVTNENRINEWFNTGISFYYDLDGLALNRFQFGVPLAIDFGEEFHWSVGATPYAHLSYYGTDPGGPPIDTPGGFPAENEWIWNFGAHFGAAMEYRGLHAGVSFFNAVHTGKDFTEYDVSRVYVSYRFEIQEDLDLEPVVTFRLNEQSNANDFGAHLWIRDAMLIGAHWRTAELDGQNWLILQVGYAAINQFEFYTSFDFDMGVTYPGFTAEVGLQYSFNE